ncbi:MAG TPA: nitroreductase [Gammaproteobacteria bacterium]|nr:nitroreductase [Gammaproteobacteria bacterium]
MDHPTAIRNPAGNAAGADALEALLADRYSCRGFRADPVARATIERILAIAQHTASWCNAQPWRVAITGGEETGRFREALYAYAAGGAAPGPDFDFPRQYTGVYRQRRRECGFQLYEAVGVARGDREAGNRQRLENFRFFGAPHLAIVTTEADLGVYGAVDCGAYVSNFMLAARSLGVASIAQAALAVYPDFIRDWFDLPPERLVVCGLSFGYEDRTHPANAFRTTRAPLGEVVTWRGEF